MNEFHHKRISPVEWDKIDLIDLKTKHSNVAIAATFGISETAVRKRLKKVMVPREGFDSSSSGLQPDALNHLS